MMTQERDQMKGEVDKLFEEKREKESMIVESGLALRNSKELEELKAAMNFKLEELVEMKKKNEELLKEKKGAELDVKVLTEAKDRISRALGNANEELKGVGGELVDANRARKETQSEVVELQGEVNGLKATVDKLEGTNKELLSQIHNYSNPLDVEKTELENLMLQLAEMEGKIELANRAREEIEKVKTSRENQVVELQGEINGLRASVDMLEETNKELLSQIELAKSEFGQMRSEKKKLYKKINKLENHVDVMFKAHGGLQGSLEEAQQKCRDMEILKQQLVSMEKRVADADAERNFTTSVYAAVIVLVGALTAYITKFF